MAVRLRLRCTMGIVLLASAAAIAVDLLADHAVTKEPFTQRGTKALAAAQGGRPTQHACAGETLAWPPCGVASFDKSGFTLNLSLLSVAWRKFHRRPAAPNSHTTSPLSDVAVMASKKPELREERKRASVRFGLKPLTPSVAFKLRAGSECPRQRFAPLCAPKAPGPRVYPRTDHQATR